MEEEGHVEELKVRGIIGFDGSTIKGLIVHCDGKHIVYPIGNKVIIQEWETKKQYFLQGHTNIISALSLSSTGKYIASGQINHIGFRAQLIIWSFNQRKMIDTHELHKVRVEAVAFSRDEKFCISLGGRDCESVFVWDIETSRVVCGAHVTRGSQGEAYALQSLARRSACFMTGGDGHLAVWTIDKEAKSVTCFDVALPKIRRTILCIDVDDRDEIAYCGSTTGDVLKVRMNFHHNFDNVIPIKTPKVIGCFARISKKKLPHGSVDLYQNGVRVILRLYNGSLLIGAGNGTVDWVQEAPAKKHIEPTGVKMPSVPALKSIRSANVYNTVTSIQLLNEETLLVSTTACEIFKLDMNTFDPQLIVTCHTSPIYSVAFPKNFSDVFVTASKDDVRVWSIENTQELLRIVVQNFSCSDVLFSYDGKCILTAWNDGIIRAFTPLTGRLMYSIFNAHNKGVSAIAISSNDKLLVSGGCEGQVRLWEITPYHQSLICTLKEHKGPVSAININKTDDEAVSASTDATCILWDLKNKVRRQIIFANTLFMTVRYYPTCVQILTGGSDRKIYYWEVLDGSLVRELEGSQSGSINAIDISPCGEYFVTGSNDQMVKVWKYQEGIVTRVGLGHSAVVTAIRYSPNGKYIVTTSAAGSIFVWNAPQKSKEVENVKADTVKEENNKEENIKNLPSSRSSITSIITNKSSTTESCSKSSCSSNSKGPCTNSKCSSFVEKKKGERKCTNSKCSSYVPNSSEKSCKLKK